MPPSAEMFCSTHFKSLLSNATPFSAAEIIVLLKSLLSSGLTTVLRPPPMVVISRIDAGCGLSSVRIHFFNRPVVLFDKSQIAATFFLWGFLFSVGTRHVQDALFHRVPFLFVLHGAHFGASLILAFWKGQFARSLRGIEVVVVSSETVCIPAQMICI